MLSNAPDDNQSLACLLLITRFCPAAQLGRSTLRRVFEAVGFSLPTRLLVSAAKGDGGCPPEVLLGLAVSLLAGFSSDPELVTHPQLLKTVPLLLDLVSQQQDLHCQNPDRQPQAKQGPESAGQDHDGSEPQPEERLEQALPLSPGVPGHNQERGEEPAETDTADQNCPTPNDPGGPLVQDCYEVLWGVCGSAHGPALLLSREAVPALCRAYCQSQALSRERGLPLLAQLMSGPTRKRAWERHAAQLTALLDRLTTEFCQAPEQDRLQLCTHLPAFLPPVGGSMEVGANMVALWGGLRPLLQARLSPAQLGLVLVLAACLLDLAGWAPLGSARLGCLLVNRACVEVRMGLEEPPGAVVTEMQQHILTACYRILEAALEQACSLGLAKDSSQSGSPDTQISLQQGKQLVGVLQEAFSATIYYLQQVTPSRYGDPFVFVTFRALCAWLAEETSCLRQEVTTLLPFLIGYAKAHLEEDRRDQGLANWMAEMSVGDSAEDGAWSGEEPLRLLLPALCHLTAEEGPRGVLLSLGTPALLTHFLSLRWGAGGRQEGSGDPSMETACSALLNITVTEKHTVRTDPSFTSLQSLLVDAVPALLHKPRLLMLAVNFCTLGLLITRLRPTPPGVRGEVRVRRFIGSSLQFLLGALCPGGVSTEWAVLWAEGAAELWRLSLQALAGSIAALPWLPDMARDGGWLRDMLELLTGCAALPDSDTLEALQEFLTVLAQHCPHCRHDIAQHWGGALSTMTQLHTALQH
ncbi:NCDN protein, partial [Amia calva]|nr:NCDN protein [Amia calva]